MRREIKLKWEDAKEMELVQSPFAWMGPQKTFTNDLESLPRGEILKPKSDGFIWLLPGQNSKSLQVSHRRESTV